MSRCILLVDGERICADAIVGNGADSFVIRLGDHVLKIPTLHGTLLPDGTVEPDSENEMYIERLDPEKRIYERLHGVPGIAKCIECTSNGILLKYYRKGDLERYIAANEPAPMSWRWRWIMQATEIISNCHENGVLVFDIALRNFLLADDFGLRLIDFSNSALLSKNENISTAEVDGTTVKVDILNLSNVIYSVMTWQKYSGPNGGECAMESEWSNIDQMPDVDTLEVGHIMRACWNRQYTTIQELVLAVRLCADTSPSANPLHSPSSTYSHAQMRLNDQSS